MVQVLGWVAAAKCLRQTDDNDNDDNDNDNDDNDDNDEDDVNAKIVIIGGVAVFAGVGALLAWLMFSSVQPSAADIAAAQASAVVVDAGAADAIAPAVQR